MRDVPRGIAGRMIIARSAMIASAHTTSRSVNPLWPARSSVRPAGNIRRRASAALLPIRAVGNNVIRPVLSGQTVEIWMSPRVVGHDRAFEIRPIPTLDAAGTLHQRRQALGARWIAPG